MRKLCFLIVTVLLVSCTKYDEVINLLNEIKAQNEALKADVMALQATADSLSIALKNTNTTVSLMDRKIDSVKLQISVILTEINTLNTELQSANANIADIQAKIAELQKKCEDLFALLNMYIVDVNLSNGLVAYYPFNSNANDETGNGNNGTVDGAILTTDRFGNANKAYEFNNNLITVPHHSSLGFSASGSFSVSLWAYRTGTETTQHFIGKRPSAAQAFNWQMHFNMGSGEGMMFTGNINYTSMGAASGKDCPTAEWVNLTGVYSNNTWKLYENGSLIATQESVLFTNDVNTPLTIGNSGNFEPFYGKLDDIRIYNRELSQSEVSYLHNLTY
jgi:hypothetical protein